MQIYPPHRSLHVWYVETMKSDLDYIALIETPPPQENTLKLLKNKEVSLNFPVPLKKFRIVKTDKSVKHLRQISYSNRTPTPPPNDERKLGKF